MYTVGTARYLFFKGRVRWALTPENGTAIPVSLRWRTLEEKSSNGFEFRLENGFAVQFFRNSSVRPKTNTSTLHAPQNKNDEIGKTDNRGQERWAHFLYIIQKSNTDFPSLCAWSESNLTIWLAENTKRLLCACSENWTFPEVAILGTDQKQRGL